eukprot:3545827-Pleurochrysis_carterae.AAC.1
MSWRALHSRRRRSAPRRAARAQGSTARRATVSRGATATTAGPATAGTLRPRRQPFIRPLRFCSSCVRFPAPEHCRPTSFIRFRALTSWPHFRATESMLGVAEFCHLFTMRALASHFARAFREAVSNYGSHPGHLIRARVGARRCQCSSETEAGESCPCSLQNVLYGLRLQVRACIRRLSTSLHRLFVSEIGSEFCLEQLV